MSGGSLTERDIDDVKDFQHLENAMNSVGIDNNKKMDIFRIVAAVLHLGNINFQESTKDKKGIRSVLFSSMDDLSECARFNAPLHASLSLDLSLSCDFYVARDFSM